MLKNFLMPVFLCSGLLLIASAALAGETCAVRVSCTIPAIPGVNAPLIEGSSSSTGGQVAFAASSGELDLDSSEEAGSGGKNNKDESQNIEKTEETPLVLVKTFYSK